MHIIADLLRLNAIDIRNKRTVKKGKTLAPLRISSDMCECFPQIPTCITKTEELKRISTKNFAIHPQLTLNASGTRP